MVVVGANSELELWSCGVVVMVDVESSKLRGRAGQLSYTQVVYTAIHISCLLFISYCATQLIRASCYIYYKIRNVMFIQYTVRVGNMFGYNSG